MKKILTLGVLLLVTTIAHAQFTGSYNIGSGETYTTLKAACDAINAGTVDGNVTFLITSDLTEPANVALGVNTNGFTITFKPSTGVVSTVTYTQVADNAGTSGAWVIGQASVASGAALVPTNNIVIDGSNTVGGTTRDLIFVSSSGTNAYPFRIRGNNDNITIKNCEMTAGLSTIAYGIWINPVFTTPNSFNPDNLTIENCKITSISASSSTPIHAARSGTITVKVEGLTVKNNHLIGRNRLIFLDALTNITTIQGNTFEINQTSNGFLSGCVFGNTLDAAATTNIIGNYFKTLATANITAGSFGMRAIIASGGGTWNIVNNMISGFSTAAGTTEIIGIRCGSTVNAYYNTIVLNNVNATAGSLYRGFWVAAGTPTIKNNLVITEEDDFANYCIYGAPGTSDYNNFYRTGTTNAQIGNSAAVDRSTLADWQLATGQDVNSKSASVAFVSTTDLHLDAAALPNYNLTGTPIGGYTTDIDGDTRNASYPYIGADENLANVLPVELTSFTAVSRGKNVELRWNTATETNNHGFDVEKSVNGVWNKVGFVQGAGNSNSQKEYGYVDAVTANGTYSYRLKQIDRSGKFNYIPAIEVNVNTIVRSYDLAQNFPNPFNPTTTIRFSVQQLEQASVKVFDITGREVATLFNDVAAPGQVYNVQFNATGLASGIYFYVLQTANVREVKKMQLLK